MNDSGEVKFIRTTQDIAQLDAICKLHSSHSAR